MKAERKLLRGLRISFGISLFFLRTPAECGGTLRRTQIDKNEKISLRTFIAFNMKKIVLIVCLFFFGKLSAQNITHQQYKEDFGYFWTTINNNYCYWDKKQTDWGKVKTTYSPLIDTITTKQSFILLLEKVFYELYDHHASLNTNTPESQRLVPSGTDLWAEYVNGKPKIIELRSGFGADKVGMKEGMQIIAFNDVPVETAIASFLPKGLNKPDDEAKNYALRLLLAGNHSDNRKITVNYQNQQRVFYPDKPVNFLETKNDKPEIESKILKENIGYILINNSLGDNQLIQLFDSVLTTIKNTRALILDLRNTPSGGNTTVARSILGRFISKEGFYQKHVLTAEEKESGIKRSWVEIVSPKNPAYKKPLVVLVDHWTGSVSEGMAIGFDALKRATIIGTRMAALNGAVYSFTMPNTNIGFSFPAEKLFHVNGTPRENFQPIIAVDISKKTNNEDYILEEGLRYISTYFAKHKAGQ
jgi:C-terminal processing protease CtpA/Prc